MRLVSLLTFALATVATLPTAGRTEATSADDRNNGPGMTAMTGIAEER